MAKSDSYSGNAAGIVVQNNDPEKRGRVKIFIPHLSPTIYKGWNEIDKDKRFKFIGLNIESDLTPILEDLKSILPWAECATPLVGANSIGRYNSARNIASISDSANISTVVTSTTSAAVDYSKLTQFSQNIDSIGEKPGNKFDIDLFRVNDAFIDPAKTNVNNVNKFSYDYIPETFSNSAKGSFAIPNVGSHVWVFFVETDPLRPVYFASALGRVEWNSIYSSDYSGDYENTPLSANGKFSVDTDTYRNKFVINQKAGTLQFNNTDNKETVKLSHYSGSFKAFNNFTTTELATKNDQKLVLRDQFLTVRGDRNIFIGGALDTLVSGDSFLKIGNLLAPPVALWRELMREVSDIKQLFDIKRANQISSTILQLTSPLQQQQGSPIACPVCAGSTALYWKLNNKAGKVNTAYQSSEGGGPFSMDSVENMAGIGSTPASFGSFGSRGKIFGDECPSCNGTGRSTSSMNGLWSAEEKKNQIVQLIKTKIVDLAKLEQQMGLGGSWIIDITKHKIETIGLVVNNFGSVRVDELGKMDNVSVVIGKEGVYENKLPTPLIEYVQVDDLPGGSYTLNVCNKYNVQVGSGGLFLKTSGPINIAGSITNIAGTQVNIGSEFEVNVDGGKRLNLTADVVSIKQRHKLQVLIDSSLGVSKNVIIGGGLHVEGELTVNHITAPAEIQETESTVVFGTAAKDIIGKGTLIGTAATLYNTALGVPGYIGIPDPSMIVGYVYVPVAAGGVYPVFGSGVPSIRGSNQGYEGPAAGIMPVEVYGTGAEDDCFVVTSHSHNFKNLPLTLTESNDDLREKAKSCNDPERIPADPIFNTKK